MNILITSAGRRGYIVDFFKQAIGKDGKVYVGNNTRSCSAAFHGDGFVLTPSIYDDNYIDFLIDYCIQKNIKMIISLFDVDLPKLAQNKELFRQKGIEVIISDERVISICNDKWLTNSFALENGIKYPKSYLDIDMLKADIKNCCIDFPIIIKPRWGMGSIGVHIASNSNELITLGDMCKREIISSYLKYESSVDFDKAVIYQQYINGEEFGLDIINNLKGEYQTSVIKQKLAMRAGETDSAMVVQNNRIEEFARKIGKSLHHIADLDVDILITESEIYLLDMNARFGGGYPFSHLAGVNVPKAIFKWIRNEDAKNELIVKRYNRTIYKEISFIGDKE